MLTYTSLKTLLSPGNYSFTGVWDIIPYGDVLYDVLLINTDPDLVKMELDLAWVFVSGNDPVKYLEKYPIGFPYGG